MRTHVILSDETIREVDQLVGKRKRSRFVEEAIKEKLKRAAILSALRKTAGILAEDGHPEWKTSENVAAWVRESRRRDVERTKRVKLG